MPGERAVRRELARLDVHCRRFIELSPFLVMATGGVDGMNVSPRGGEPGFVRVVDDMTLRIPDAPGNTASTRSRISSPTAASACCS
jgi:predicted pyridoxine 5'-phosphate oxidase superfamily flavin-nucleotide-binding protein